eukprot:2101956-Alexandrium_andersonii.AAC.1
MALKFCSALKFRTLRYSARPILGKCKMAPGVRNLNCAVPEQTSELAPSSAPQGLVRGVRRRFAR